MATVAAPPAKITPSSPVSALQSPPLVSSLPRPTLNPKPGETFKTEMKLSPANRALSAREGNPGLKTGKLTMCVPLDFHPAHAVFPRTVGSTGRSLARRSGLAGSVWRHVGGRQKLRFRCCRCGQSASSTHWHAHDGLQPGRGDCRP